MIQPGPVRLKSLSVNLVCEVITRHEGRDSGETYYSSSYPFQLNIFRSGQEKARSGGRVEHVAEFRVPDGSEPTSDEIARRVVWRIEVWGRVARWADFMHPYTIKGSGKAAPTAEPETEHPLSKKSNRRQEAGADALSNTVSERAAEMVRMPHSSTRSGLRP